jgi:threonine/homoserine/homoserine lactone efflux protein
VSEVESVPRRKYARLLFISFITGFSGAMMPGPLLVATIGQTTVQGFRAVISLVTGHALLELVILFLLIGGLRAALRKPRVRGVIGVVGGAVLLWMGGDMLRGSCGEGLDLTASAQEPHSILKLLIWGAGICAANPYFTGWWATVGAGQFAYMAPRTPLEYFCFYIGHEASDYTWYAVVGLIVITGRHWMSDEFYRWLIFTCGVIIIIVGTWFLFSGAGFYIRRKAASR